MKTIAQFFLLLGLFQSVYAQNVMISNQGNPNEPSIMMDFNNPNHLVAGSNLNYVYNSQDGGITWNQEVLNSSYGVWGDPVIDVDTNGDFYFFHLSNPTSGNWIDRIICQKSTDNGESWSNGTFTGLNGNKQQDKHWSVVDRSNNNIYITWTEFDQYGSSNPQKKSRILFSKSLDGGASWSTPIKINHIDGDCIDEDNTVEGATPAVGPNGEIYVAWAGPNGLVFNKSLDQGETWLSEEIQIDPIPGGWDYSIPGINRANGLPITKCDLSGGENHGTIYVNWSDQRNGENDTDIWLVKSTDAGNTWSDPIRVNDDGTNKQQFFTWMDIDQINGNLFFVFYDRRNYSNNNTDVYLAVSEDGGGTFVNKKISESPFIPNSGVFFGDYTNVVAHNNIVRPIWTRLHNGQLSIWTDITPLEQILSTQNIEESNNEIQQYPNPAKNIAYVSFKLHKESEIDLFIFDSNGRMIKTLLSNKKMNYGKHVIPIDLEKLKVSTGVYFYQLQIDGKKETMKTLVN